MFLPPFLAGPCACVYNYGTHNFITARARACLPNWKLVHTIVGGLCFVAKGIKCVAKLVWPKKINKMKTLIRLCAQRPMSIEHRKWPLVFVASNRIQLQKIWTQLWNGVHYVYANGCAANRDSENNRNECLIYFYYFRIRNFPYQISQ